ncbi:MAG TPA: hypothetical protein VFG04_00495 [Planctomycetaceae bacterium]|jgi:hypothetical protein|nr:hypothetical protein [Planctomycetaceae bacterium]
MPRSERLPLQNPATSSSILSPIDGSRTDLVRDLVLPTLLFTALGGMTWAVRGCAGFGAWKGCVFAGVTWGTAWWYLAHDPRKDQSRRYASAWIVVALTFGIGIAGIQGWMQWPSLFEGKMMTKFPDESVPISRAFGFLWLFLAGAKWAGIGACFLAWSGSLKETRIWHWIVRIILGLTCAYFARFLIQHYPQHFIPLYAKLQDRYADVQANPNLGRMMNDCTEAVHHLGLCIGFLLFEVLRRDWKNVVLILTVSIVNGIGWSLCQNWNWAKHVWPPESFNFWRCWESSGGLSMGLAFGIAYFLVNRPMSEGERAIVASRRSVSGPNFEWLLIFLGLTWLMGITFRIEVPWIQYLPDSLPEMIRRYYLEYSSVYMAVICGFAAGYYFCNRKTPISDAPQPGSLSGAVKGIEPFGLLLTLVLIVGLFVPIGRLAKDGEPHTLSYVKLGQLLRLDQGIERLSAAALRATGFLGSSHDPPKRSGRAIELATGIATMELTLLAVMLLGTGWYFLRRSRFEEEKQRGTPTDGDPNVERLGLYLGLLAGLGLSLQYGLKGCLLIRGFDERVWDRRLYLGLAPAYLLILVGLLAWIFFGPKPRGLRGTVFPHAAGAMWLVLIVQNAIAQAITGPHSNWHETAFAIYYALLFATTMPTIFYFQTVKKLDALRP